MGDNKVPGIVSNSERRDITHFCKEENFPKSEKQRQVLFPTAGKTSGDLVLYLKTSQKRSIKSGKSWREEAREV